MIALVATAFGFGPVSKAVTVAGELKSRLPAVQLHYFGCGIDFDFAQQSGAFDLLRRIDVDAVAGRGQLMPLLKLCTCVISVLNLALVSEWPYGYPPIYVIDSLAWMWPQPPKGIEKAAAYFVQAYLVPPEQLLSWVGAATIVLVGPIVETSVASKHAATPTVKTLLVNFSGCANPFAPAGLLEQYALVLAQAILSVAACFDRILFCCSQSIANSLRACFRHAPHIEAAQLPHGEFLDQLRSAACVLTTPGITTTLELAALGRPFRFLLPQNYSQALLSERYRADWGDTSGMALSRFGREFRIPPGLAEEEGVAAVNASLHTILSGHQSQIARMLAELIDERCFLGSYPCAVAGDQGQHTICDYILANLQGCK